MADGALLIFAYGSNLAASEIERTAPEATFVGTARLPDHRLELRRRSIRWGGGAADVVPAPGDEVWGALYELPERAMEGLHAKEGAGFAYRLVEIEVIADGGPRQAFTYEVIDKEPDEVPPTPAYAELLLAGARDRRLPEEYVETLERRLRAAV